MDKTICAIGFFCVLFLMFGLFYLTELSLFIRLPLGIFIIILFGGFINLMLKYNKT